MDTLNKLKVLKDTCLDDAELDRVLGKLLEAVLNQHWLRLKRYDHDL